MFPLRCPNDTSLPLRELETPPAARRCHSSRIRNADTREIQTLCSAPQGFRCAPPNRVVGHTRVPIPLAPAKSLYRCCRPVRVSTYSDQLFARGPRVCSTERRRLPHLPRETAAQPQPLQKSQPPVEQCAFRAPRSS